MNRSQKIAVILAGALMILMLLFPPFHSVLIQGIIVNQGYAFLFSPPVSTATVNVSLLLMQWLLVVVLGLGAILVLRDRY